MTYLWNRVAASIPGLSGRIALPLILTASIIVFSAVFPAQVQSQQGGEEVETVSPFVTMQEGPTDAAAIQSSKPYAEMTADELRAEISTEIARMRRDIADVERFKRWQADLMRIARTDQEEALRQRLPMSECRASVLSPICDHLTGTFRPDAARGANPTDTNDMGENAE